LPKIIENPTDQFVRAALYGPPKTGKSWLALSLPSTGRWAGRIIYVAADPGSENFAFDPRVVVVKPTSTAEGRHTYDPIAESAAIASHDWKADFPDASTLIWDTMTQTSRELLGAIADSGSFSDKHVYIGKPGTNAYIAAPMPGDYGAAQRSVMHLLSFLYRQPLHVIVLWHGEMIEPDSPGTGIVIGGPASIGKAIVTSIGGLFNNLFFTECRERTTGTPPKRVVEYVVHTRKKAQWMAGIRLRPGQANPIPEIVVPADDPTKFWREFDSATEAT
jgi:hypothetical protein